MKRNTRGAPGLYYVNNSRGEERRVRQMTRADLVKRGFKKDGLTRSIEAKQSELKLTLSRAPSVPELVAAML